MLLDVLGGMPGLAICTGYQSADGRIEEFPADAGRLEECRPVLEKLPGWSGDVSGVRRRADLPDGARRYVERIESLLNLPVRTISVGPDREQTILD
jgi:adenylosuccinate synthase